MANNNYHNNTLCVTLLAYHPHYRDVEVTIDDSKPRKVYKHLKEHKISQAIGTLNVRLRNPNNTPVREAYHEYLMLKSGISAGRYIAQSAACFADLFDDAPPTSSSIRQAPI